MTIIREIEQKISDAFQGGEILTRELRLTSREADYIRTHYQASLTPPVSYTHLRAHET